MKKIDELYNECYLLENRELDEEQSKALDDANEYFDNIIKKVELTSIKIYPLGIKNFDDNEQEVVLVTLPDQMPRID